MERGYQLQLSLRLHTILTEQLCDDYVSTTSRSSTTRFRPQRQRSTFNVQPTPNNSWVMANSPIYIEDDSPPPSPRAQSIPKVIPNRFSTPHTPLPTRKRAFVEAPHLATAQKQQYKSVDETFPRETRVDEVIGEYRDGTTLYYFARYAGGIAYKVGRVLA